MKQKQEPYGYKLANNKQFKKKIIWTGIITACLSFWTGVIWLLSKSVQ